MGPRGVNEKKRAGLEKKANVKAAKDQALAREEEKAIGEEWKKGANIKGQAKAEAAGKFFLHFSDCLVGIANSSNSSKCSVYNFYFKHKKLTKLHEKKEKRLHYWLRKKKILDRRK